MPKKITYTLGSDVPEGETLRDGEGRVIDDEYVGIAVTDALAVARGRGRPSLSRAGESPMLRVRLPRDLDEAVRQAAEEAGTSRSDWVRRVLARATGRPR